MNSDQNSIQNQGGGQPKPYKPEDQGGDEGNNNNNPNNPSGGQGFPGPSNTNTNDSDQGGNMGNAGGGQDQGPANIPSPPGSDSNDFNENFSQSKKEASDQGNVGGGNMPAGDGGGEQPPNEPPKDFGQADIPKSGGQPKKSNKKLFIVLLIIILALGAAVAVYFLFLSPNGDQPTTTPTATSTDQQMTDDEMTTTTETDEEDETSDVPTVPSATTSDESTSTDDQSDNQDTQTDEVSADSHESLLSTSASVEETATLDTVSVSAIQSALDSGTTETALFKEVILADSNDNLVTFGEIAGTLSPTVFTDDVINQFEQDATVVTYTNSNGTWIGLVANLTSEADATSVQNQVSSIEDNVSEVRNFFISDPGTANSWADGGAGDVDSRYITFSDGNAAFNYGWSGDMLVIGTTYSTFQEIVEHL